MDFRRFSIPLLNKSLIVFFRDALRVAIRSPGQAMAFFRTLLYLRRAARKREQWKRQGVPVPPIVIFSITQQCNLQCEGCYAQAFHSASEGEMETEQLRLVIEEARQLGVSFFVLAGGEPFMRPEILDITADFPEMIFMIFSNGLLIDDEMIAGLKHRKNVVPLLSLEGSAEDTDRRRGEGVSAAVHRVMDRLRRAHVFFGTSMTIARENYATLTEEGYIRDLVRSGCKFFLFLEYTPIQPGTEDRALTGPEREKLIGLMKAFRSRLPALFITVPGDEAEVGGCLAAGRGFVHINAAGDLEPCPFAPFSDSNVLRSSLKEALCSPLLEHIRRHPEKLVVTPGGCVLWKNREWVQSLLDREDSPETVLD